MDRIGRKKAQRLRFEGRIDFGIILIVLLLMLIGTASLYVALSHDPSHPSIKVDLIKQGIWYMMGIMGVFVIMQCPVRFLKKATPYLYGFGLFLLTILLKFYDRAQEARWGSKSWFSFGPFSFQPSELVKIFYLMMLAYVVAVHNRSHRIHTTRSDFQLIGKMFLVTFPVILLILLQKDFGTMLVFLAIFAGIFIVSGVRWQITVPLVVLATVLVGFVGYLMVTPSGQAALIDAGIFKPYQIARIDAWLDPFHDPSGKSFQLAQGLLAIGSGQIFGKGFNVSHVYVPVRESDMIFTVIGENFGFIGGVFVILLYFFLIYRILRVCFQVKDQYSVFVCVGVVMTILFHVIENIGANIGLLPLTGIPLPFISQGGSALLSNMLAIGLVLALRFDSRRPFEIMSQMI